VITELANIKDLFVIARNSVFPFKAQQINLEKIRDELNVNYIVEGSIQRSGDQLRINSQLIDVNQGNELWAKRYDRTLDDVFLLQDDIARSLAGALQVALKSPQDRTNPGATQNREAYDAYLHGKYLMDREEGDATNRAAIEKLERAVALDPNFALAHAALALVYRNRFFRHEAATEWEQKAFVEVEKALALDPNLAEAYVARGRLVWTRSNGYKHEEAIQNFRHALELNPNQAEAHRYLGIVYFHLGFFQAADEERSIAQSLDPLNPGHSADRIFQYFHNQKFDLALKEEENLPPGSRSVFRPLLLSYLGRQKDALESIQPFLAIQVASSEGLRDDPAIVRSVYTILLARSGDFRKAEESIDRAIQNDSGFSHFHHAEYNIAVAYAIMGKVDLAVDWLQKTADHGFPCYPSFENDPYFQKLRSHPPYVEFLAKMKQQWEQSRARLQL
jgi:adenylate cyclase